jgi:hypothetical protein
MTNSKTIFKRIKKTAFCGILISLLVLNLSPTVLADDTTPTPPPPAEPATAPDLSSCKGLPLAKPFFNWEESNQQGRAGYCAKIECLNQRIETAQDDPNSMDIEAKNYRGSISDDRCQTLKCANSTNYYSNFRAKNNDTDNNCKIDSGLEVCEYTKLPEKTAKCESCKQSFRLAENTPIDQSFTSSITFGNTTQTIRSRQDLNEQCGEFRTVTSCIRAYYCNNSGDVTVSNSNQTSGNDYQRTPFGTEFFDVTDTQTGLKLEGQGNNNFNTDIEGGPIIGTINTVANFLVRMISVFALVVFIIGAFLLITANGDENRINQGKDALKYSLLGIVIVMMSYTIIVLVQSIFF